MEKNITDITGEIKVKPKSKKRKSYSEFAHWVHPDEKTKDMLKSGDEKFIVSFIEEKIKELAPRYAYICDDIRVVSLDEDGMYYVFLAPYYLLERDFTLVLNNRANNHDRLIFYRFEAEKNNFKPNTTCYDKDGNKYYAVTINTNGMTSNSIDDFDFATDVFGQIVYL